MFIAILLLALVLWAAVATVVEWRRDGYRAVPTDWSRVAGIDPSQRPEATTLYR
ncbi:hypothetical protein [Microbacterium sp.]|uniref:hypothetical protein n=1 Tax=Microbacterium sp. TaxID=51671 RepID=UPI002810B2BA|nr:hypothetical protein [Microbacterium sp.]